MMPLPTLVLAALVVSCSPHTVHNPNYCDSDYPCKNGKGCDVAKTHTCILPGGGSGGAANNDGSAGGIGGMPAGTGGGTAGSGDGTGGAGGGPGTGGASGTDAGADRPTDAGTDGSDGAIGCPPCTGTTPICDTTAHTCVACLQSNQCTTAAKPICDSTASKTCVGCLMNDQCVGATPVCDTTGTKTCVGCLMNNQCTTAAKPICGASKTCGPCTTDPECMMAKPSTPVCRTSDGTCVQCNAKQDCMAMTATPFCLANKCVGCTMDSDCSGAKPICDPTMHACVACGTDAQCMAKSPDTPACLKTAGTAQGTCVACNTHAQCDKSPTKPICVANVCTACTSDKQCVEKSGANPGVCMFHTDGHCATGTEVLYVKPDTGCDDNGTGTIDVPYCAPQNAIMAATANKSVIVMRKGTQPMVKWSFAGATPLSVIGQGGASISGAGIGIAVTSGEVYIRGLGVSGMTDVGISVSAGATLKLDQAIVTMNRGGLVVNGGGFEINNSVFADNGAATAPVAFGGVYLKNAAAKPAQFRNNTIYANAAMGLVCDGSYVVRGLLVANNTGGQVTGCDFSDLSSLVGGATTTVAVDFDPARPYHLTANSPCVDRGNPTDFPTHDLDGNPRPSPAGGRSDCGAHELQP